MCGAGIWGERNSAIGLSFGRMIFVLGLKDGLDPKRPSTIAAPSGRLVKMADATSG